MTTETAFAGYEQWYTNHYGHRGSLKEAVTQTKLHRDLAEYVARRERKIAAVVGDEGICDKAEKAIQRALKMKRAEMRQYAKKMVAWALIAQVRIATGAPLT